MLKPGGALLFRDYGRNDLVQLRFKKERYMEENLYVRGDGTRVYFFDIRAHRETEHADLAAEIEAMLNGDRARFGIEQLEFDRRLLLNRKRRLTMWRVWIQGRFHKLG